MIDQLDNVLRMLLMTQVPGITSETQVRFQPPDDEWRNAVANLTVNGHPANAVNIYLADLRENVALRSNQRTQSFGPGGPTVERAHARVDCHYFITAWSPAAVTAMTEPTVDEHLLLYQVLAALMRNVPLNPSRFYPPGSAALGALAPEIRDADLPTEVIPHDGFSKLGDFWGAMGAADRWKPGIYLVVTLPVTYVAENLGPLVTTRVVEFRQSGSGEIAETWVQIGGAVLDPVGQPVADAWVAIETATGTIVQTARTGGDGRFTFGGLKADQYRLRVRAGAYAEQLRQITIPQQTGEYDLQLV